MVRSCFSDVQRNRSMKAKLHAPLVVKSICDSQLEPLPRSVGDWERRCVTQQSKAAMAHTRRCIARWLYTNIPSDGLSKSPSPQTFCIAVSAIGMLLPATPLPCYSPQCFHRHCQADSPTAMLSLPRPCCHCHRDAVTAVLSCHCHALTAYGML